MPWPLPQERHERLALAKAYPFDSPSGSYLFAPGDLQPIGQASFAGRTPVIAHGSNRSPQQLLRKFGHLEARHAEIPVTFGWLGDYDVVYAAHITRYGAISSTLRHTPECRVRVAINWLTDPQLTRMHETEGASTYPYGRLADITLDLEAGPVGSLSEAFLYHGRHGCLAVEGSPVGLAAVSSDGRPHAEMHQEEILTHLRDSHGPAHTLDGFILRYLDDLTVRETIVSAMREAAVPARAPHFRPGARA